MSNTNLTGTELNYSEVKPEENKLKGREAGSATKADRLGKKDIEQGVESLTIVIMPYIINGDGERFDKQGNKIAQSTKSPSKIQEMHTKMEKFNQAIEKEQKEERKARRKRQSGNEHESR